MAAISMSLTAAIFNLYIKTKFTFHPKLFHGAIDKTIIGIILKKELILLLVILSLSCNGSAEAAKKILKSDFDMAGTITGIITPSSILVGDVQVDLDGVNAYCLYSTSYFWLMQDLNDWLIGKDVFVKGNYVYFDLNGAYNSDSINGMIEKEIWDLCNEQYHEHYYRFNHF